MIMSKLSLNTFSWTEPEEKQKKSLLRIHTIVP